MIQTCWRCKRREDDRLQMEESLLVSDIETGKVEVEYICNECKEE